MSTIKHLPTKSTVKCRKELLLNLDCRILETILTEFDRAYNEYVPVDERMIDGLPMLQGELVHSNDTFNYIIKAPFSEHGITIYIGTCYRYLNGLTPDSLGIDIFDKALSDITLYYLSHPMGRKLGKERFPKWTAMIVTIVATLAREEFSIIYYAFNSDTGVCTFETYSRNKSIYVSIDLDAVYNSYHEWVDKCYIPDC